MLWSVPPLARCSVPSSPWNSILLLCHSPLRHPPAVCIYLQRQPSLPKVLSGPHPSLKSSFQHPTLGFCLSPFSCQWSWAPCSLGSSWKTSQPPSPHCLSGAEHWQVFLWGRGPEDQHHPPGRAHLPACPLQARPEGTSRHKLHLRARCGRAAAVSQSPGPWGW